MWPLILLLIFCIGCIGGWIIEVIYRSFKRKSLTNPGFLNGPYLPLYGFGSVVLFLISSLELDIYYLIPVFALVTTLLELLTGSIFTRFFNIDLWDYSGEPLNYKGIISLKFSVYWTVLAVIFYLAAYPLLEDLGEVYRDHLWTSLFVGFFYGVFLTDVYNSFSLALKIRKAVNEFNRSYMTGLRMDMKRLRREMRGYIKDNGITNRLEGYFLTFNRSSSEELLERFEDQLLSKVEDLNLDIRRRRGNLKRKVRKDIENIGRRFP